MSDLVTLERPHDGVALVTMTNPKIQNFGSWDAIEALAAALKEARESGARVSVLASGAEGHWYEHAWLTDLSATLQGKPSSGNPICWFQALSEITSIDVVTIAAVSGDCSGGGAELGWACDLRVAEEQVRFGQPEVMIGVATGLGGTCRVSRLIGRTATAELVLDGAPMTARRIYELGGVNRIVETGRAVEVSVAWAQRLASRPPGSLRALKQMLADADNLHLNDAMANEQKVFQGVAGTPEAFDGMARTQVRFDAGESVRDVYGDPQE